MQNLSLHEELDGVEVAADFISGSHATGCLVVMQGPPTSPDIFRALRRNNTAKRVIASFIVPPSNYTVYGYDLEETSLPNTMPAAITEDFLVTNAGPNTYLYVVVSSTT